VNDRGILGMNEQELESEITRIGKMLYSHELAEKQNHLKYKLRQLRTSEALKEN